MDMRDGLRVLAKAFAVVTFSIGAGLVAGAITYVNVGPDGRLFGGAFGHVAEIVGWGTGCLTASAATTAALVLGRRGPSAALKPSASGRVHQEV
jgi:hypothetical protein